MAIPSLRSVTARLDRVCADILGDEILYKTSAAGTYATIRGHADLADGEVDMGNSVAVAQNVTVNVLMEDVPARPINTCRVQISLLPGLTFRPVNSRRDAAGTGWDFELEQLNA